jgi:hypothetical protein
MKDEQDATDIERGRYDPPTPRPTGETPSTRGPAAHPVPDVSPGGSPDPDDPGVDDRAVDDALRR